MQTEKQSKFLWLSHPLSEDAPMYGGGEGFRRSHLKTISTGDSCNALAIELPAHFGSHVDTPLHFLADGKSLIDYSPGDWIFYNIRLLDYEAKPGELITLDFLTQSTPNKDVDLLLIRSGFERKRSEAIYWKSNPGMHPESAIHLQEAFPNICAIGFDFISLTSFEHRETGREAHRKYLSRDIRIFEDLTLQSLQAPPQKVTALPLRINEGDGAPCTILAEMSTNPQG